MAIILLAAAGALATFAITGPPSREVACDPKGLAEDEACLETLPQGEDAGILWVDARSRAEWEKNGLPGSILWNLDPEESMQEFEADAAPRLIEAKRVVVYCGDEQCGLSRQVANRIRQLGFEVEVVVLYGGWRALQQAGRIP